MYKCNNKVIYFIMCINKVNILNYKLHKNNQKLNSFT